MTIIGETHSGSQNETTDAVYRLQAEPTSESLTKFLSVCAAQIDVDPEFQFIAAKAKILLGIADPAEYDFLLNYFEGKGNVYAAMCCAEALLLKDENNDVNNKHVKLMADYNNGKEKELTLVRETFIKNPPEFTISVIMPTYKRHQYIRHAIQSVMNQTFRDFEIIVVNDGGSRECEAVIESFKSDNIRYLYIEHGGLSHALNQGILASRSKYIAYLDDDDRYLPDHLQNLVSALESSYSFVYSDAYREVKIYKDKKWNRTSKTVEFSYDFKPGRFAEKNYIPVLCMAHRRDCFERIGLFELDLPNAMDWDLWAKAARLYDFKHIKKVTCVYEYRLGPGSLSGRQLDNLFFGAILRKHHRYLVKQVWSDLINRADRGLIGYAEIESKILRYHNDKYQLSEWLLPLAFAKGEWHSALSLITKMTRHHPSEAFSTLRRLCPKISNLSQLFSLCIFLFISSEYVLKHWSGKVLDRRVDKIEACIY